MRASANCPSQPRSIGVVTSWALRPCAMWSLLSPSVQPGGHTQLPCRAFRRPPGLYASLRASLTTARCRIRSARSYCLCAAIVRLKSMRASTTKCLCPGCVAQAPVLRLRHGSRNRFHLRRSSAFAAAGGGGAALLDPSESPFGRAAVQRPAAYPCQRSYFEYCPSLRRIRASLRISRQFSSPKPIPRSLHETNIRLGHHPVQ